ncbi:hypothetical protein [Metabacillus sp. FJAT-52054]|uniref:DNA-binding protein n=1 Tax=Metabacillus sediminis TaxID=3117746 RepID=A0ABZ2NN90_9BACI
MGKSKEITIPEHIQRVLNLIPEGSDSPITVRTLSSLTGFHGTVIRDYISQAVVKYGQPIGTSNSVNRSGYYVISTADEREATIRNLRSRAIKILKRAKALEKMPDRGQIKLHL